MTVLPALPDSSFDLVYIDPPFNTGRVQSRARMSHELDPQGQRVGFKGKRYRIAKVIKRSEDPTAYRDQFDDFIAFLRPRILQAYRLLSERGSFFLHLDYREVHYAKVMCDEIFGRRSFINEIIWAYDYGARAKSRWSPKHDNILFYAKNPDAYTFNYDAIDRIPYMAPGLVTPEKAARGKTPTDCWWNTIVSPTGKEKTGYPTQKPLAIISRIIKVHSNPGDRILDFFAGSGTTAEAAARLGRHATLVDSSPAAIKVIKKRLEFASIDVRKAV